MEEEKEGEVEFKDEFERKEDNESGGNEYARDGEEGGCE